MTKNLPRKTDFKIQHNVVIDGKTYEFAFDHSAYAALEKQTGKSIYEFYDDLLVKHNILFQETYAFISAGLLKYHTDRDISDLQNKLRKNPGLWHVIKEAVCSAFIDPLLPPEILLHTKKKVPAKKRKESKTPDITG